MKKTTLSFFLFFNSLFQCSFCSQNQQKNQNEMSSLLKSINGTGQEYFKENKYLNLRDSITGLSDSFERAKQLEIELDEILKPPQPLPKIKNTQEKNATVFNFCFKNKENAIIINAFREKINMEAETNRVTYVHPHSSYKIDPKTLFLIAPSKKSIIKYFFHGKKPKKNIFLALNSEQINKFSKNKLRNPDKLDETIKKICMLKAKQFWTERNKKELEKLKKEKKEERKLETSRQNTELFCNKPLSSDEEDNSEIDSEWEILI